MQTIFCDFFKIKCLTYGKCRKFYNLAFFCDIILKVFIKKWEKIAMVMSYIIIGFVCFFSIFWGVWGSNYFLSAFNNTGVAEILPSDMAYIMLAVVLPIVLVVLVGVVFFVVSVQNQQKNILVGMARSVMGSSDEMQVIGKSLIEVRKLGFTNQFFMMLPFILNDMSQSVADIISHIGIASEVVVYDALSKSSETRMYAVCRILLDKRESTPHFEENLRRFVKKDAELSGKISLFDERYEKLLKSLKVYDIEHIVADLIEEGNLGRVHNILVSALKNKDVGYGDAESDVEEEEISFIK